MNFFEHQDRARRQTGRLVLLMALAVISLIALTSLALTLIWHFYGESESRRSVTPVLDPTLVGAVALVVIGVVLFGSLYKRVQLNAGGKLVAESLGGRLINLDPQDFHEKRLLNVVEEMALACGAPVPSVYVLEEDSINAFAAGLSPKDAVIGVTQGAMSLLDRDELQGVIAHEFSHIYNGDMRLNMRLIALLHGILLIGLIGHWVLRSDSGSSRRSSSSNDNKGELFKVAVGLTLLILGYAGTFFGNLIKAAVSRQREFLADASAVQFTRNPDSIGGALKKIGGHAAGSQLRAANAAEFSHLYFGAGIKSAIDGLFATHPPLAERIRRIEPGWDGQYPQVKRSGDHPEELVAPSTPSARPAGSTVFAQAAVAQSIAAIGDPGLAHLQEARDTLQTLPEALIRAVHDREGAQALVYGLLLDSVEVLQQQQLDLLRPHLQPALAERLEALRAPLREVPQGQRLALVDLAIPALRQLGRDEFNAVKRGMALLIRADDRVELLEWTLLRIVERNVEGLRSVAGKYRLEALADEVALLLSFLARAGQADPQRAGQAFAHGCAELAFVVPAFRGEGDLKALEAALYRLTGLLPLQKPALLKAMARCIGHDGQVTAAEAELMRAVADILDCPMPPLLAAAQA
ncbi:Zn-dependent protease with chaperone function [Pseudomonas asplenii]|uniref:Zn-dependent protease with chaperone function n=1 Tax=Pseudomonas asplenii TaxID=53407 RepID=A0A0N0E3I6_9PSED|nr:M48 family metallopeptidase [Pseudomonas fuscovaginae]KPA90136.1 Zn-dependent protease with chaperone function [Pseudomonas fuscovaginae]